MLLLNLIHYRIVEILSIFFYLLQKLGAFLFYSILYKAYENLCPLMLSNKFIRFYYKSFDAPVLNLDQNLI